MYAIGTRLRLTAKVDTADCRRGKLAGWRGNGTAELVPRGRHLRREIGTWGIDVSRQQVLMMTGATLHNAGDSRPIIIAKCSADREMKIDEPYSTVMGPQ